MQADFSYVRRSDGFFVIMPDTPAGEREYNRIFANGVSAFLPVEFEAFKKQARAAGYTVRKYQSTPLNTEKLLKELVLWQ